MEVLEQPAIEKYEAYKDSGVEWLGEIPEHWDVKPGFSILYEAKEKNTGMVRNTVLSLSYGKIRIKLEDELTGLVPESFETYQLVDVGDIIFRPTDLQNDHVSLRSGISEYEGIITSAYLNLRVKDTADHTFYSYLFRAIDNNKVIYGLGSGLRQNIDFRDFRRFPFPFPPLEEQTAIANFLDRKTALIEQAIAIKEKQIKLLKERRQILIHNAVTRGLDPNVKMKDSGVEWIGEIPEGWEVSVLSYIAKIDTGSTPDRARPEYWNGSIPWVKTGEVNYSLITSAEEYITEKGLRNSAAKIALQDTILMAMYGQGVTRGRVSILGVDAAYNQACCAIAFEQKVNYLFGYYFFVAAYTFIRDNGNETSQMNLSAGYISKLKIPIPSKNEQLDIIHKVQHVESKTDNAIDSKCAEIEKLKEYKAALINSAVMGKIKVC